MISTKNQTFALAVAGVDGEWIIKGFIDVYRRVYTISVDTVIVSKVLEILLLPSFAELAARHDMPSNRRRRRTFIVIQTSKVSRKRL